MDLQIFETAEETALAVAGRVTALLRERPDVVIGLPAGRTPVGAYAELRRRHHAGEADFSRVSTFNLDEFVGIPATHPGSFRTFMERHLFEGINIDRGRIHVLNGCADDLDLECAAYESAIERAGGIDLLLLGIGSNGHIGFNEPADRLVARTHRVRLEASTRRDNAALFGGEPDSVPEEALSMGIGTILGARALVLIATGERKAECIERAVKGGLSTRTPASFLQLHPHVEVFLDRAASSRL